MKYAIEFTRSAQRALEGIPERDLKKVARRVDALADNPRPPGTKKLRGGTDEYRLRVGDYRVIYSVTDSGLLVTVIRIAHRRDAYR